MIFRHTLEGREIAIIGRSLGTYDSDPAIAPDLIGALSDDDRSIRLAAARSLIQHGGPDNPSAARVLIAMATTPEPVADRCDVLRAIRSMSPATRDQAAMAYADLIRGADPKVLPDLLTAIAGAATWAKFVVPVIEPLLDHTDPNIRARAGLAIFAFECPGIAESLPFASSSTMIKEAIWPGSNYSAPESLVSPKARTILGRVIGDPMVSKDLRRNAVELIQMVGPSAITRVTPALVRQLADPNPAVRQAALELLLDRAPAALPTADASK